ncbi:MAG: response regulator [Pirellulaceae bacterium]|jgi:CheY-like chemotaxis protein|nr:response regulator [Pirellulaceae bacterium]
MSALLLSSDLLVTARVASIAREIRLQVVVAATGDAALDRASSDPIRVILLDVATPGLNLADLVPRLRDAAQGGVAIIAFGPHVDDAVLEGARQAGCDKVLARGQFLNQVAAVLLPYVRVGLASYPRPQGAPQHDAVDVP